MTRSVKVEPAPAIDSAHSVLVEARLASIRLALAMVEPFGAGPASDPRPGDGLSQAWTRATEGARRRFDEDTGRVVAASSAGLDALIAEQARGRAANPAATERLAAEIHAGLSKASLRMAGA